MSSDNQIRVSEEEYETFYRKAKDAVDEAIEKKQDSCIFHLSWMNNDVALLGRNFLLSYLVFSPDSEHPIKLRLIKLLKQLRLVTFIDKGYHLSYRGCEEGTHVTLKQDDPTKDKPPAP